MIDTALDLYRKGMTLALFPWATGMRVLGVIVNDTLELQEELTS